MPVASPARPYHFACSEVDAILAALAERGFAVARGVVPPDLVRELEADVWRELDPARTMAPGESRYSMEFIEHAPAMWRLLEHEPYMRLCRARLGGAPLVVHRSAAILRLPGSPGMGWHSDTPLHLPEQPRRVDHVLNRLEHTSGGWLYLSGCRPEDGGLAVIDGSHRADWPGPAGYRLLPEHSSFARDAGEGLCMDQDVPGMVRLTAEPGDLVMFEPRTFHFVHPHRGDRPRVACGVAFRDARPPFAVPWTLPIAARQFRDRLPRRLRPLVEGYTGIVDQFAA